MSRRRNETAVVTIPGPTATVDALVPMIEASWSDERIRHALHAKLPSIRPGTRPAARLAQAADMIEDADLLLSMARRGLAEALDGHTLRELILSEADPVIAAMAEAVANAVSGAEESVAVSLSTRLVSRRLSRDLGLDPFADHITEILVERFGREVRITVGDGSGERAPLVAVASLGPT